MESTVRLLSIQGVNIVPDRGSTHRDFDGSDAGFKPPIGKRIIFCFLRACVRHIEQSQGGI